MKYHKFNYINVDVSTLCLGAMMFGGVADATASERIIAVARDNGVNFIDTADTYVGGESERIVGGAIKGDRDHWILATKAGDDIDGIDGSGGLSRGWLS